MIAADPHRANHNNNKKAMNAAHLCSHRDQLTVMLSSPLTSFKSNCSLRGSLIYGARAKVRRAHLQHALAAVGDGVVMHAPLLSLCSLTLSSSLLLPHC
jgi:polysaccharide deacetylase 2 family uncharacterized protein YibQ